MRNLITHPKFGEIRIKKEKGEPLFCAKDVCEVLNLSDVETSLRRLDDDEKLTRKIYASGQNREMLFVNESGLYTLVIRSNKPEAKKFRKWVTAEVLPAIRRYGFYTTNPKQIDRAEAKVQKQKILDMLSEIEKNLSRTDIRLVAKQCYATEWQVEKVLKGEIKDPYMLTLLYSRSTGNKILNQQFYTAKGAEKLMEDLRNLKIIKQ